MSVIIYWLKKIPRKDNLRFFAYKLCFTAR